MEYLGYDVRFLSANVLEDGNKYDHVLLMVKLGNDEWLVDVGFGDCFYKPLKLEIGLEQFDQKGLFKMVAEDENTVSLFNNSNGEARREYRFFLNYCDIIDFYERCRYFERAENSKFSKTIMCSIEDEEGRKSLKGEVFSIRKENIITKLNLKNDIELRQTLFSQFGIRI